ncbi:MAG: TonB-dependent copper receptor [Gammaproteobacteria bacterium RBG_16_51_14]|nr:MAG: TonB-dependent copper receptor [Gammaproteobacteria bacterium RBG_16_51_14]
MKIIFHPGVVMLVGVAVFSATVPAADMAVTDLDTVVVTAPPMTSPLFIRFDPRAPQQPLPAQDGAAFLKAVPGMSVIRKGGTDGDPVFRGMAASRLNILLDGENIYGGCSNRMDPPTAYVFPETYDRVTVLKGPQTVLYGPGASAGTVLFEREHRRLEEAGWKFNGSLMGGSFGRHDEVLDLRAGNPDFYVRGTASHSHAGDYRDGDGIKVHSEYTRWSAGGAAGWTPDQDTRFEVSTTRSDGEAAYADRGVDGSRFARDHYGIRFDKTNMAPWLEKVEVQAYYNYIDHVMDDYKLRRFVSQGMGHEPSAMNPDRTTTGGRLALALRPGGLTKLTLGLDSQSNEHTGRISMSMQVGMNGYTPGQWSDPYQGKPRVEDALFEQEGVFAELTQLAGEQGRIVAGLRSDWWSARDRRLTLDQMGTLNPTANKERDETLFSGFARYEHVLPDTGATLYAGLGHVERFPDFWELFYKEGTTNNRSSFASTDAEKTNQLDAGATWKSGRWSGSVAGFYNRIDDFILIQSNVSRGTGMLTRTVTVTRNVDATTWGGEAGLSYAFSPEWQGGVSLAGVHGRNETDHHALGQMPPLEGRFDLAWDNRVWSAGALLRLVSAQDRYALNEGNIVGQDLGPTSGFGVFSINGGYRLKQGIFITGGVDNLFDRTYAEHISRNGASIPGFVQTTRVNEPGRTLWIKAGITLD